MNSFFIRDTHYAPFIQSVTALPPTANTHPANMLTALSIQRHPPPSSMLEPHFARPVNAVEKIPAEDGSHPSGTENTTITLEPAPSPEPAPTSAPSQLSFSSLPAELRDMIWREALPRHVISLRPGIAVNGVSRGADQEHFSAKPTTRPGSHMPQPLAGVCYESRAVATRSGRWVIGAEGRPVWFDPKQDIVLLNSRLPIDYFQLGQSILQEEDLRPRHRRLRPNDGRDSRIDPSAIVSIADVAGHQLVGCLDEALRGGGGVAVNNEMLRSMRVGKIIFSMLAKCAAAAPPLATMFVYFDEVALTGTQAQAMASGLFGSASSPEEQMLFVPISDRDTLHRINELDNAVPSWHGLHQQFTHPDDNDDADSSEDGKGSVGNLRVGNAGFLRTAQQPFHALQNLRILATHYLRHFLPWHQGFENETSDVVISRALDAGMPTLEQAILFRFHEVTGVDGRK